MRDLKTCFKKVDYDLNGLLHYKSEGPGWQRKPLQVVGSFQPNEYPVTADIIFFFKFSRQ